MLPGPSEGSFKRVMVEATKFHLASQIDLRELGLAPGNLTVSSYVDSVTRRAVLELTAKIARGPEENVYHTHEVSWPDGWWQAFKAEVLPRTRLTRWLARKLLCPVRYKTETLAGHVKVVRMCPHLPIPQDGHGRHLEFLVPQQFEPYRW